MIVSRTYRFALVLLAGWFLAVQSFSTAHASTYGDHPHEHDGVACAVLAMVEEELAPLPDVQVPTFIPQSPYITEFPAFTPVLYFAPQTRAPPPRAPPLFH